MLDKLPRIVSYATLFSVPLMVIAVVIAYLFMGGRESMSTTLFMVGACPIIIFAPGLFSGSSSGALHTPKVVYRLVDTLTPRSRKSSGDQSRSQFNDSLSWVLAGLILWLISYFI